MCGYQEFFLGTPFDRYEYMQGPLSLFPDNTIEKYDLWKHANNDLVYVKMRKAVYGLP